MNLKLKANILRIYIISVIALIGCCGLGFSLNSQLPERGLQSSYSSNDSIVINIIEALSRGKSLGDERKIEIERKIKSFPGRIVRRDTSSYFLQSILGIAYNEFVTEDFEEVKKISSAFCNNVEELNPFYLPIKYGLIKFSSFRIKDKEDSHSEDLFGPSPEFIRDQNISKFIVGLLPDLPLDLNLDTYRNLLNCFKESGGFPRLIGSRIDDNFFERCAKAERRDILELAEHLWCLEEDILDVINKEVEIDYSALQAHPGFKDEDPTNEEIEQQNLRALKEISLQLFDADGNIDMIDSLIAIGHEESIGKYIDNFQYLKNARGEYREIIDKAAKYELYIPLKWQPRFYGYWGIAHLALGENDEALEKFEKSFDEKTKKDAFSGSVLNYATALAQKGEIDNAIRLYRTQEGKTTNINDSFNFWDGLGYLYSFICPDKALEYYERADSILLAHEGPDFNVNSFLSWPTNNGTRHFARKSRMLNKDLFKLRNALQQARLSSGVDSYFSFYGGIPAVFYRSEAGRFKNLLFDFKGAGEEFELARGIISRLDPQDYRIRWWNESWQDLNNFISTYGKDTETILETLKSGEFSSLHKIWLLGELAGYYGNYERGETFDINFINESLAKNLVETIYAVSYYESRNLPVAIYRIQEILMNNENLQQETEHLAELNLLRKGALESSKTGIEKHLLESNRTIRQDYLALCDLRKQLNYAYAYEDSLKIRKLLPQIANNESRLYYSLKDSIKPDDFIASDVISIRSNLSSNDLAIDFVEIPYAGGIKTGAFIYFPDEKVEYVDLTSVIRENGKDWDFSNIWIPLLPFMENKENIYFSPDGRLINKGIEYYPDSEKIPIFQNYRLHRVSHLRNLGNKEVTLTGGIALIGVSDHNSPIGEGDTISRGNWSDLREVEYEINLIDHKLKAVSHNLFYNDSAIEENIKALEGSDISILHFSTHGVYRNRDSLINSASNKDDFDHNVALRTLKSDRQEICGIILRRGNLTWQMPHLLDEEDDILTAEEIEVMNFPKLQLTVLSACDSGLGEINSDGIQGLQRAFKIAGSKNIICSLNKVDDYWSAQFMGELYKNLAEGLSIYDSFRNAQISIKLAAPDNPVAWSSYILIE